MVGGDQQRAAIVPGADKLKEDAGFSLVFGDVSEVIEDQEVEFVELGDGGFESELATGNLLFTRTTDLVQRLRKPRRHPSHARQIHLSPAVSRNELRCDPSPLPGLRISETRETTEGSAELEFRIQFPPLTSRILFIYTR